MLSSRKVGGRRVKPPVGTTSVTKEEYDKAVEEVNRLSKPKEASMEEVIRRREIVAKMQAEKDTTPSASRAERMWREFCEDFSGSVCLTFSNVNGINKSGMPIAVLIDQGTEAEMMEVQKTHEARKLFTIVGKCNVGMLLVNGTENLTNYEYQNQKTARNLDRYILSAEYATTVHRIRQALAYKDAADAASKESDTGGRLIKSRGQALKDPVVTLTLDTLVKRYQKHAEILRGKHDAATFDRERRKLWRRTCIEASESLLQMKRGLAQLKIKYADELKDYEERMQKSEDSGDSASTPHDVDGRRERMCESGTEAGDGAGAAVEICGEPVCAEELPVEANTDKACVITVLPDWDTPSDLPPKFSTPSNIRNCGFEPTIMVFGGGPHANEDDAETFLQTELGFERQLPKTIVHFGDAIDPCKIDAENTKYQTLGVTASEMTRIANAHRLQKADAKLFKHKTNVIKAYEQQQRLRKREAERMAKLKQNS